MSGRVKYLIEKEENKKLESLISMKLGLLSSIAVILSLVLDAISLFININGISVAVGAVELAIFLWAFGSKKSDALLQKITNKELFQHVLDTCAMSAVFSFIIERSFLPLVRNRLSFKMLVLYLIVVFLALPIIVFIILFNKKARKYTVDGV